MSIDSDNAAGGIHMSELEHPVTYRGGFIAGHVYVSWDRC
jgi:hypothetical protein